MEDTLKGQFKDLWIAYQNDETAAIGDLTYDQLTERIGKWESIEFEARAKRQKCNAEKRTRDLEKAKGDRDKLVFDPHYSPSDSPSAPGKEVKLPRVEKSIGGPRLPRRTKEEKVNADLGELGLDLKDLLKDVAAKKQRDLKPGMVNQEPVKEVK